ncbi:MAG: hypothetical protein HQ542_08065, partial [Bacteroidia bacterium]|nr:hypothetical protein [Bacteroidia bacterium]
MIIFITLFLNPSVDLNLRIGLIIVASLFAGVYLPGQNPYIHHYTTADGLPSNTVYYVFQDSKKFIWFATDAGVARFDGSHFDYYQKKDGLSSNEVVRIQEDSFGRIWFFNLNGTLNFFWHNTVYNERNAPFLDSLISKEFFRKFFQDEDQMIYFYYNHQRDIFALDSQNHVRKFKIPGILLRDPLWLGFYEGMVIRYLNRSSTGEFLLWTRAGLYKLKTFSEKPTLSCDSIGVLNVFPGKKKTLYVPGCFQKYTESGDWIIFKYSNEFPFDSTALPTKSNLISSILEDISGYLWLSTFDKGVFCLMNKRIVRHYDIDESQAIMQDNENNIWISSMSEGVYKISPYLNLHQHYDNTLFQQTGITALADNPGGGIWCTNGEAGYLFQNTNFYRLDFPNEGGSFNQILMLKNNTLVIGEQSSHFYALKGIRIDPETRNVFYRNVTRSFEPLKKIAPNLNGDEISTGAFFTLVISPSDQLFMKYDFIDLKERIYNTFYNSNNELIVNAKKNYIYRNGGLEICKELSRFDNKIITDHLVLNDSTELINIEGDSLYLFTSKWLCNLTAAFSYPLDFQIKHMVYDEPRLYLATVSHIYICDNPLAILRGDPLYIQPVDIDFKNIHDILIQNGLLYVASDDGLTVIPDTTLQDIETFLPTPYFQSILINDQERCPEEDQVMLKGQTRINLVFSSKSYSDSPVIFSYMLEGADHDWIFGSGTNVVYQNLPPGEYVFKVRARKPTTPWSQVIKYRIT